MLDNEEIVGSMGMSTVFMDKNGHRILFGVHGTPGYIEIKKAGWLGFTYECFINGQYLIEATQTIAQNQNAEKYDIKIDGFQTTYDGYSDATITWYCIEVHRISDGFSTVVHRRFKDFALLHTELKQHFKGHHLLSSLPHLPEKKSKLIVDHNDSNFLQQRASQLQTYLATLLGVPHVADLTTTKAFVGLMEQVRETSLVFTSSTLGISLIPCESPGTPAVVGFIQSPETCPGLMAGDIISKINGKAAGSLTFTGVVNSLKRLPRPIVVHFVQTLAIPSSGSNMSAWRGDDMPTFEGDKYASAGEFVEAPSSVPSNISTSPDTNEYTSFKPSGKKSPGTVPRGSF